MKKWLFNPFIYIAGARSLIAGLGFMLLTAVIAFFSHTHFDGAIDMHTGRITPLSVYLLEQLVDWGCLVMLFYIGGQLFSRTSVRLVDVAGTIALARWPLLFAAALGFGISIPRSQNVQDIISNITPLVIICMASAVVFCVWMIALLYNAFIVSSNMKTNKAIPVFITVIVIAEVCTHLILHQIYTYII